MNEAATEPKPKRRWYQYSLRSLLIVMVLLCFLFAWLGVKIQQAEKQKEIVAWVEKIGGSISYDYKYDTKGKWIMDAQPPGPDWLREWIGIDYFSDVVAVGMSETQVEDVSPLGDLTELKLLDLYKTQVKDVSPLKGLKNLEWLVLEDTLVKDISPLRDLTNLYWLDLNNTLVKDISPIRGLTNLEVLHLGGSQVSTEEALNLQKLIPNCSIDMFPYMCPF